MEYRGYKITLDGDKWKSTNAFGTYWHDKFTNSIGFIKQCALLNKRKGFVLDIVNDVFKIDFTYVIRGNYDVVAATALNNGLFVNMWADIENDKAEITFINIAPIDTDKPMNTLIMRYYCDFYLYYHVESVKKIDNRLIIKFR